MSTMRWRWRWVLVPPAVVGGMAALLVWSDAFARLAAAAKDVSTSAGLTIAEVWVEGRSRTEKNALIRVLAAPVGPAQFVRRRRCDCRGGTRTRLGCGRPGAGSATGTTAGVVAGAHAGRSCGRTGGKLYAIEASGHVIDAVMFRDFPELPLVGWGRRQHDARRSCRPVRRSNPRSPLGWMRRSGCRAAAGPCGTDTGLMVHLPETDPSAARWPS